MAVAELSSVFSLPTLILPTYSDATASTVGDMARQGPHHGAQKSTKTGTSAFRTSWSNAASVKVRVLSLAISLVVCSAYYDAKSGPPDATRRAGAFEYSLWYSTAEASHEKSWAMPRRIRATHVSRS